LLLALGYIERSKVLAEFTSVLEKRDIPEETNGEELWECAHFHRLEENFRAKRLEHAG
jgi:hypothetical protein